MQRLRRGKGGQATAVGSVLFFMIAVLLVSFLYDVYLIQAAMNQFDAERGQERLEISNALFGNKSTYSAPDRTNDTLTGSSVNPFGDPYVTSALTIGVSYPVRNMNFSSSADGWTFTRSYNGTGSGRSASGAFTTEPPAGSLSGAGSIYQIFTWTTPTSGGTVGAIMNYTTRFYVDLDSLGGPDAVTAATLSWGVKCSDYSSVLTARVLVYLQNTTGKDNLVDINTITGTGGWVQTDGKDVKTLVNMKGWYKIIVETYAELRYSATETPIFKTYVDDIGLRVSASNHVTDWLGSTFLDQDPTLITQIDLSYSGSYDRTVSQQLYIYDFTTNSWVLLDRSTISTSSRTIRYTLSGVDVQNYIHWNGTVRLRVYAVSLSSFQCVADRLTTTVYYVGTTDRITISFRNMGGVSINLVSLWIVNSTWHDHFDGSSSTPFNIVLSPGETETYTARHSWSTGEYAFKVITDKGTIATYSTTA